LEVGFRARWIWAEGVAEGENPGWQVLTTANELARREMAWKDGGSPTAQRMFPPACLHDGNLVF